MMTNKIDVTERLHIRWMIRRDMAEVMAIENLCFEFNALTDEEVTDLLRIRNHIGMVVECEDESIAGYMIYGLHRQRIELINLAVHPERQRSHVGSAMIEKMVSKLSYDRRWFIAANVNECNLSAQLFFKSQGFVVTEIVCNRWPEHDEYRFVRSL